MSGDMSGEIIRLILDYGGSAKSTEDLTSKLDSLKAAAKATGIEGLDVLVGKVAEAGKAFKATGEAADAAATEIDHSFGALGGKLKDVFTQFQGGDVAGGISTIGELLKMAPGLSALAGPIGAVSAALAVGVPLAISYAKAWAESLQSTSKAVKEIANLAAEIERGNTALLKGDEIQKAREADQANKEAPGRRQQERAETFKALVGTHGAETTAAITEAIQTDRSDERKQILDEIDKKYEEMYQRALQQGPDPTGFGRTTVMALRNAARVGAMKKAAAADQQKAADLMQRAQAGDAGALKSIERLFGEGETVGEIARLAGPEELAAERESKRFAAEQEHRHAEHQRQEQARQAAFDKVRAGLETPAQGAARATARAEGEGRGPRAEEAQLQKGIEEGRAVGRAWEKQKAGEIGQMILENQRQINAMQLQEMQRLRMLDQEVKRGLRQTNRTAQSNGFPF